MTAFSQMKINYNGISSASATQGNWVGAQNVTGRRPGLPLFSDVNSFHLSGSGNDSNPGTLASPKKTLGGLFASNLTSPIADWSANNNTLEMTGTVPAFQWDPTNADPNYTANFYATGIKPAVGKTFVGPFSASNYLSLNSAARTAVSGLTSFTMDCFFYVGSFPGVFQYLFLTQANGVNSISAFLNTQLLEIQLGAGTVIAYTVPSPGLWYMAVVFTSGVTGGFQLWLGPTAESAVLVASGTQTYTTTSATLATIGIESTSNPFTSGFINRLSFSSTALKTFPITRSTSGVVGVWGFSNTPLIVSSLNNNYVVYEDSSIYNESLYANLPYDIFGFSGIYANDDGVNSQTPVIQYQKGALPGTYGVGNSLFVQITGTPDYYVSKTGNDSNAGTSGSPFKTLQHAINSLSGSGGRGMVQVLDSGVYQEDLVMRTFTVYLTSATGQTPTILAYGRSGTSINNTAASSASITYISNFILDGGGSAGVFYGIAGATGTNAGMMHCWDCTIKNYAAMASAAMTTNIDLQRCSMTVIGSLSVATTGSYSTTINMLSCYLITDLSPTGSQLALGYGSGGTLTIKGCTFQNCNLGGLPSGGFTSNATIITLTGNLFNNASSFLGGTSAGNIVTLTNNVIFNGNLTFNISNAVMKLYLFNNLQYAYTGFSQGFLFNPVGTGSISGWAENCVSMGNNAVNFAGVLGSGSPSLSLTLQNCTSLNATTAGYSSPAGITAQYCIDSGSVTASTGGMAYIFSRTNAAVVSTVLGNENITLLPSDAGFLNGPSQGLDCGFDWPIWWIKMGGFSTIEFNGLTFSTASYPGLSSMITANQECGIFQVSSYSPTSVLNKLNYCSFVGLGTYGFSGLGMKAQFNFFNTNGNAYKLIGQLSQFNYNVGWNCGGAFVCQFGFSSTINNNSSYSCAWGEYDAPWSNFSKNSNNIYSVSGSYDYSGNSILSYACVGTLDPKTLGSLDINSTRLNPLYRNPIGGDLRLQAIDAGYYFNSPACGTGTAGADMGAFSFFTYNNGSISWTLIDFSLTDSVGPATGPYRNPDVVNFHDTPFHLAEGDMENGVPYSVFSATKTDIEMTWNESSNPMPTAQVLALKAMFENVGTGTQPNNAIQIDLGDGVGFRPAYFVRSQGFEYTAMTGGYSDSMVPTPVKEIVVRLA